MKRRRTKAELARLTEHIKRRHLLEANKLDRKTLAERNANFAGMDWVLKQLSREFPENERLVQEREWLALWANYTRGLESPDLQHAFRMIGDLLASDPDKAMLSLKALKYVRKRGGRPPGSGLDDDDIVKLMGPLVATGMSVPEAARKYVNRAARGRAASNSSVVKRLTRKFHRRSKRRGVGQ